MSLALHGNDTDGNMLSPAGMAAAGDLLDLGLEPIANIDDDDPANNVRAPVLR